jgi:hypothetical protein
LREQIEKSKKEKKKKKRERRGKWVRERLSVFLRVWGDWEAIWYIGMGGAFVLATYGLATRPDQKPSAWARREVEQRRQERKD